MVRKMDDTQLYLWEIEFRPSPGPEMREMWGDVDSVLESCSPLRVVANTASLALRKARTWFAEAPDDSIISKVAPHIEVTSLRRMCSVHVAPGQWVDG